MFSSFQKYTSVFVENLSTRLSGKNGEERLPKKKWKKQLTWAWKGWGSFRFVFVGSKHVAGRRLGSDPTTATDGLKGEVGMVRVSVPLRYLQVSRPGVQASALVTWSHAAGKPILRGPPHHTGHSAPYYVALRPILST